MLKENVDKVSMVQYLAKLHEQHGVCHGGGTGNESAPGLENTELLTLKIY